MSLTLRALAGRVHQLTGDLDADRRVVSSPRVYRLLMDRARVLLLDLGIPETWTTAFVTLSDTGSSDFTASAVYGHIKRLRLASTGAEVRRASPSEVEALRAAVPLPTGPPQFYYVLEPGTAQTRLRFHPRPVAADTVEAEVSALPSESALPGDTLDLDSHVMSAIVHLVAADVLMSVDDEALARLQKSRESAAIYARLAGELVQQEKARRARLRRVGHVSMTWAR